MELRRTMAVFGIGRLKMMMISRRNFSRGMGGKLCRIYLSKELTKCLMTRFVGQYA
jgi:hypothetical protein